MRMSGQGGSIEPIDNQRWQVMRYSMEVPPSQTLTMVELLSTSVVLKLIFSLAVDVNFTPWTSPV